MPETEKQQNKRTYLASTDISTHFIMLSDE